MDNQIQFGKHTIDFELKYATRKTLGIKVNPDTSVLVTAPQDLSIDKINEVVRKKAMWILNQKSYFLAMNTISNDIIVKSGYSVNYLGRRYKITVKVGSSDEVSYLGNEFKVQVTKKINANSVFEKWLRQRAYQKITEIAKPMIISFGTEFTAPNEIVFQEMQKRWGSCTLQNKLIFNPKLIHTPKRCIEYVVMHELCHIVHKNHGREFFNLLSRMMPDWELRKMKLDSYRIA